MEVAAAFVLGAVADFILGAAFIWRPRLIELRNDRDRERERRITAEDHASAAEAEQVKVVWPDPMESLIGEPE